MEKYILNQTLVHQMGMVSRQIAEEKYDVQKVNKYMLNYLDIT